MRDFFCVVLLSYLSFSLYWIAATRDIFEAIAA